MKKKLFWLLFMIVVISQMKAQNPYWEQSTGPDGGKFTLVKTATNTLYAKHEFRIDETYRSNDNGHTWQKLPGMQHLFPDASQKVFTSVRQVPFLWW